MKAKRVFLIVADSMGVGAAPDACNFYNGGSTDEGCDTYGSLVKHPDFNAPFLSRSGIGNIDGVSYGAVDKPIAAYGKMKEGSAGKDTVTGHWELCGAVTHKPMPTFPNGFPTELLDAMCEKFGRGWLCNKPYSGTEVIRDYGREHIETGKLIIYTSSDSVLQIAAHEEIVPVEELYKYCMIAREMLCGEYAVGRVIARPFVGQYPDYVRTSNRHDYALEAPVKTLCDLVCENSMQVIGIGKIGDIFAHRGITEEIHTESNIDGILKTEARLDEDFTGLCFVNLVDFDSKYGHRRNVEGYVAAVNELDHHLEAMVSRLRDGDVLIVTADHGCDPAFRGTDHTREYVPVLIYGKDIKAVNIGTRDSFADLGKTIAELLCIDSAGIAGKSFAQLIKE